MKVRSPVMKDRNHLFREGVCGHHVQVFSPRSFFLGIKTGFMGEVCVDCLNPLSEVSCVHA